MSANTHVEFAWGALQVTVPKHRSEWWSKHIVPTLLQLRLGTWEKAAAGWGCKQPSLDTLLILEVAATLRNQFQLTADDVRPSVVEHPTDANAGLGPGARREAGYRIESGPPLARRRLDGPEVQDLAAASGMNG